MIDYEEEVRESLLYLERTARRLLDREHPRPVRAAYLLTFHASRVNRRSREVFPQDGWS